MSNDLNISSNNSVSHISNYYTNNPLPLVTFGNLPKEIKIEICKLLDPYTLSKAMMVSKELNEYGKKIVDGPDYKKYMYSYSAKLKNLIKDLLTKKIIELPIYTLKLIYLMRAAMICIRFNT